MRKKYLLILTVLFLGLCLVLTFGRSWYWHYYWDTATSGQRAYLPAPDPCYVPPDVAVDGISSAQVKSWEDRNANQVQEGDEPGLSSVILLLANTEYPYSPDDPPIARDGLTTSTLSDSEFVQITDAQGHARISEFKPGCACKCWEGDVVFAWGPPGYEPTTPTAVEIMQDDQLVTFGFYKSE